MGLLEQKIREQFPKFIIDQFKGPKWVDPTPLKGILEVVAEFKRNLFDVLDDYDRDSTLYQVCVKWLGDSDQ